MKSIVTFEGFVGIIGCVALLVVGCGKKDEIHVVDDDDSKDSDNGMDSDGFNDDDDNDIDTDTRHSFLWVANTGESTLSKVNTHTEVEVARYVTCPAQECDPSRTSINLHGDAVVTNRAPASGESSVTKFAASIKDCIDRNNNGKIDTSTGPTDVLEWMADECMLWHTPLQNNDGARATAWDGTENGETGEGGHVLIGTCIEQAQMMSNKVYVLDGDSGEIIDTVEISPATECFYGGAMDIDNGFWIMEGFGYPHSLLRLDMGTKQTSTHKIHCGYGISVDSKGRVWTGGKSLTANEGNCVQRYDPELDESKTVDVADATWLRGIAVGTEKSDGYVWAVDTSGKLYKVDEETLNIVESFEVGDPDMVGVAIDYEGYVWTVSMGANATYKVDPDTGDAVKVPIGKAPYTYSDMTGVQLQSVIIVD